MSNPKSVTIQLKHLHQSLRGTILAGESRSGEAVRLLNELVQLRLDRASTDSLAEETAEQGVADQVRALKLDLVAAEGTIRGLREVAEQRKGEIEGLQKQVQSLKEGVALADKKRAEDRVETRAALGHAVELIVYFKGLTNG